MNRTIRFAHAAVAAAALALVVLASDAGAGVQKPGREGRPGGIPGTIDWDLSVRSLPNRLFLFLRARAPIEIYGREELGPAEEYEPLGVHDGRAGW